VKVGFIVVIVAAALILRVRISQMRRKRRRAEDAPTEGKADNSPRFLSKGVRLLEGSLGAVGQVAMREIKERVRGRFFQVGTLVILVIVGAAILIPKLHHTSGPTTQTIAVVGSLSPQAEELIDAAGKQNQDVVKLVRVTSLDSAEGGLSSGKIDFVVVDSKRIVLEQPATSSGSPADPSLVTAVAEYLGVVNAYDEAGLTPAQAEEVTASKSVPVESLRASTKPQASASSIIGLVLLFVMLSQYDTWIMIGVMQEKSSRVVEVLLATIRPIQLLGGKVLGIGIVALGQATLIVGFALALGAAVGSDLLKGTAPLLLLDELLWLILGYAFYCWVFAAGGSTAERQDQIQTLALPLSIPATVAYIFSLTVVSTGNPDLFFKILAYLPPTAPFCMTVLVGLNDVRWWEFTLSVLISIAGTIAMAMFAARIYRRAVLQTGSRVKLRELLTR
jgi:ABC-2 type transport system permease protein